MTTSWKCRNPTAAGEILRLPTAKPAWRRPDLASGHKYIGVTPPEDILLF